MLYGSDAPGGVITVIPQEFPDGIGYEPAAYTLVHLGAGVAVRTGAREIHFALTLRNAFDQAYADFVSRVKTSARNPGQGRTLIARMATEF